MAPRVTLELILVAALAATAAMAAPPAQSSATPTATATPPDLAPGPGDGPAIGNRELLPYFAAPPLKTALAELQAGHAAAALKLIPPKPKEPPR